MLGNSFGNLFRITSFGESHSKAIGVVIDGCPSNIPISLEEIQLAVNKRKTGQYFFESSRQEKDQLICLSGIENGMSLGSPISLIVYNNNVKKSDYNAVQNLFRPSHADFTYQKKYGIRASSGGGRASARETLSRVAAGNVAQQILKSYNVKLKILTYIESIHSIKNTLPINQITQESIEKSYVKCPDPLASQKMIKLIKKTKEEGDTLGGIIRCLIYNCPIGLGEPVFDKLEAELAKAMMSIPSVKGFEVGSGFLGSGMKGSEHNDSFIIKNKKVSTLSNHSGGIQGGLSNGECIDFKVAFKPVSSIFKAQQTVNNMQENINYTLQKGRHDSCVLPRATSIVEAMSFLVILEFFLRQRLQKID